MKRLATLVVMLGVFIVASGCIFGNEKCPTGKRGACIDAHSYQQCIGGEGYSHWSTMTCAADAPTCIDNALGVAECTK